MYKVKYWKNREEISLKYLNLNTATEVASANNGYIVGVGGYLGGKKVDNSAYINHEWSLCDAEFYVKYNLKTESLDVNGETRVMSYSECMDFIEGMETALRLTPDAKRNIQLIHCSTELDYLDSAKVQY